MSSLSALRLDPLSAFLRFPFPGGSLLAELSPAWMEVTEEVLWVGGARWKVSQHLVWDDAFPLLEQRVRTTFPIPLHPSCPGKVLGEPAYGEGVTPGE